MAESQKPGQTKANLHAAAADSCCRQTCLPFLVKNSLEYLPAVMSFRGTLPRSSMISAM